MAHRRVNKSLLSQAERSIIDWFLPRLPNWVTPDKLTALGTFGGFLVFLGYALSNISVYYLHIANIGLFIHWFGDSLDGNLARFRKIERPRYGYFLDQTIDVIGNFFIAFGMGLSPYVDMRIALLALTGYHMASIYNFVRTNLTNDFNVSYMNIGPTELRFSILIMNLFIFTLGNVKFTVFGEEFTIYDISTLCFAIGFMVSFVYLVTNFAPELRKQDDEERNRAQEALKNPDT